MRSLTYAIILLAVLVGSVILLRSLDPGQISPRETVEAPAPTGLSRSLEVDTATADQLLPLGKRKLARWRVREATTAFERLVAVDSSSYDGWVGLVECYSHPLVCREDDARAAWRNARLHAASEQDTFFLAGLRRLFIDADYAAAVGDFLTAARVSGGGKDDVARFLARSYLLSGRFQDADSVLAGFPAEAEEAMELSIRVMVARGELDRAAKAGRDLARVYTNEPFPYTLLGQIEMMRGEATSAVEFCNSALGIAPRYVPAILTRANIYAWSGEDESARVSFEKLLLFDDLILQGIGQEGIAFVDFRTGAFGDGMAAMDEAIRHAIMAGSARRGLSYAATLIAYLCELGLADQATGVVGKWVEGFGEVPESLARLRIQILAGEVDAARRSLINITADKDWLVWARVLSLDTTELSALAYIAEHEYDEALSLLDGEEAAAVAAGVRARRAFVHGYAAFENGDAESARAAFEATRRGLYGVEFPYRGDPVRDVQALFFVAEAALAAGNEAEAREYYTAFLDHWGEASWDLAAVARAKEKLSNLGE